MTTPETSQPEPSPTPEELVTQLDRESDHLSGRFEELKSFQALVEQGEKALPSLFKTGEEISWASIQVICTIAESMGDPMIFPDEALGRYPKILDHTLAWGILRGYYLPEPTS